ncbi:MAG: GNAT family N-acetyltransferase [Bdellovibrionaceae bacterium]|nr:GNAT family N-acetyltransferase [Pseudobdellovibrionaceae bacterium]|tara:strand:+ start:172 stop:702 length:531 start_codon:yes stop_codon:yes gene_type:complete
MQLDLRTLQAKDRETFLKALEHTWEPNFTFVHYYDSLANNDFNQYLNLAQKIQKGENLPEGHVPSTLLFAFDENNNIVGRSSIRHELNDSLLKVGGHVGYGVAPIYRNKGYATEILRLSLDYVKTHLPQIERVLVTCNENNLASKKTIENNNGQLENKIPYPEENTNKLRYWIDLK